MRLKLKDIFNRTCEMPVNMGLTLGVRGHHAVEGAFKAGLQALSLANNAFHSAKLLVVPCQQLCPAVF